MKLVDVKLQVVRREVPRGSIASSFGEFGGEIEMGVLRLLTEEGLEGNSFVGTANRGGRHLFESITSVLKPLLLGMDAVDREWLWSQLPHMTLRTRTPIAAWAAVDVALWDLAGKAAGMPIYHLLGAQRRRAPAYLASHYLPEIERYVEEALMYAEQGYKGYKFHPGAGDVRRGKEIARRVREAVGDRIHLMADAGQFLAFHEALDLGRALDDLDFYWFEDPIRWTDLDGLAELSQRLRVRLAVTDHPDFRFFEVPPYLQRRAARIIRSETAKLGITGLKKLAGLCEAFGLNCEIHFSSNALMNAANLHVLLSMANCDFYEVMPPASTFGFGVERDIAPDEEGYVHAPTGPGLGLAIDWELINRLTDRVL